MLMEKIIKDYFKRANHKMQLLRPFEIINRPTDYDVRCSVKGGGHTGSSRALWFMVFQRPYYNLILN